METDSDCDEHGAHKTRRKHEHEATRESRDDQGSDGSSEERPTVVGEVDSRLRKSGGVPHHAKEKTGIVREQRIARHLCEQTHHRRDEDTTAHSGCFEHLPPGLLFVAQLDGDGRLDLSQFCTSEQRVRVALSVVFD